MRMNYLRTFFERNALLILAIITIGAVVSIVVVHA